MFRILISIDDKVTTDIVRTAFKQFPSMTAYPVPRSGILEIVSDSECQALVVNLDDSVTDTTALLGRVRRLNPNLEILALVDRSQKERFNRLKVDLGIFSYISVPMDPFELARRIFRLEKHLIDKHPMGV